MANDRGKRLNPVAAAIAKKRADRAAARRAARIVKEPGREGQAPLPSRLPSFFRNDNDVKPTPRRTPPQSRQVVARMDPGGSIQQIVLGLVESYPDTGYDEIAEMVKKERPDARTSAKSVASIVYRARR